MSPEAFEEFFRRSALPTAIVGSQDLLIRDVNDAALEAFGFKREETIGRSANMLGLWEDQAARAALLGQLQRDGRIAGVECRLRRRDGGTTEGMMSIEPMAAGGESFFVVQLSDVSRRAEAERRANQLMHFYSALSEIGEAVARIDDEVRLLQAVCEICVERIGNNIAYALLADPIPRVVAMAGRSAQDYVAGVAPAADSQVPGRPFAQVFGSGRVWVSQDVPDDPALAQWKDRLAAAGTRSLSVIPFFRGAKVAGAISLHHPEPAIYDPETLELLARVERAVSHAFDTIEADRERRDAQGALSLLNHALDERVRLRTRELEGVVAELDAFSYTVAHDLRAPLRAVNAYARLAGELCADDPQGARTYLEKAAGSAASLSLLIDGLLDFARAGRRPLDRSRFDADALVAQVVEELRPLYPRTTIEVRPLPPALGDAFLVRQVFLNLVSNALKFSAGVEHPHVEVFADAGEAGTTFRVRDNGVGFDPAAAGKLFGVFERLHEPGRFEGTGVGLAIVRRIVDRHGGRIAWESAPGSGATFSFTLPARLEPAQSRRQVESPPSPKGPRGNPAG